MDIYIKTYINKYEVEKFSSASGTIFTKNEFIISISERYNESNCFIMELPLSPSFGEMPTDVINAITQHNPTSSKAFKNCLDYFLNCNNFLYKNQKNRELIIYTYGINELEKICNNKEILVKIKSSDKQLNTLTQLINKSNKSFIIDFNKSLNKTNLDKFLKQVNIRKIYGIEQPFPISKKVKNFPFYNIADESFTYHGYDNIHKYGYNAFVFKPFANNFSEFTKAIKNSKNYWGVVGSNISGPLDCSFVNLLNNYLPIKLAPRQNSHFINHPLNKEINNLIKVVNGTIAVDNKVHLYLDKYCKKTAETIFSL